MPVTSTLKPYEPTIYLLLLSEKISKPRAKINGWMENLWE